MEKAIAIILVCLFCAAGCAAIKTDVAKVDAKIKAVDWTAVAGWYDKAIGGLQQALNVAQMIDPGLAPEVLVAQPVVAAAKLAGDALTAAAAKYAAETITATDVTTAAQTIEAQYKAAATAVGQVVTPVPTTAAPVAK
ncbi:MAG: hypothetical protein ABSG91_07060 [Syntrophobacteraceae bacterium]|jgi:phosphate starvation-inducible protein PhoH